MKSLRSFNYTWLGSFALVVFMVGLLVEVHRLTSSTGWRIVLELGVLLLGYGLISLWVWLNSARLVEDRPSPAYTGIIIIETTPLFSPTPNLTAQEEPKQLTPISSRKDVTPPVVASIGLQKV